MSAVAEKVIADFETLPTAEKQAVVKEILRRLPAFDSGPLDDNDVVLAGDQIAAMLDEEENRARTEETAATPLGLRNLAES